MGEKDSLTKRFMSKPDVFADAFNYLIYNHYPQLSEINSLRLAFGEPPPSEREAILGSLSEGAVSEAD